MVVIAALVVVVVVKPKIVTAITTAEILNIFAFRLEFLTKHVDRSAVRASNEIYQSESQQSKGNNDDNPPKAIKRTRRTPIQCNTQQ